MRFYASVVITAGLHKILCARVVTIRKIELIPFFDVCDAIVAGHLGDGVLADARVVIEQEGIQLCRTARFVALHGRQDMIDVEVTRHLMVVIGGCREWAEEAVRVESRRESTPDGTKADGEMRK